MRMEKDLTEETNQILRASGFDISDEWHCQMVFEKAKEVFSQKQPEVKNKLNAMVQKFRQIMQHMPYKVRQPA